MDEAALVLALEESIRSASQEFNLSRKKYAHLIPETAEMLLISDLRESLREVMAKKPEFYGNVMFGDGNGATSVLAFFPHS
jgi:hypothetical protein